MKFNKLFFAAVAFATLAMVGCKNGKNEPTPVPTPEDEEVAPEMPAIDAPAAGKTTIAIYAEVCPRGAYLVGSNQGYNINDDALAFEAVPNAENWYAVTIDFADDLQVKAIARPSDEDVAFSWSYQWGPNFDETADEPLVADESKNNTIIIGGTGDFVFENKGEVKLANVADAGVVYVWVKAWKSSPIIEAKKLETAWVKSDFFSAELEAYEWAWHEMTPMGDGVFTFEGIWGGSGCNIAETEGGADNWYPTDNEAVTLEGEPAKGDKVRVTFTSEKMTVGKLKIELIEKGEAPELVQKALTITGINVPTDWETCYMHAWNEAGDQFGGWPGQQLEIVNGTVSYHWDEVGVPMNVIFHNNAGAQTNNIEGISEDASVDVSANLK